MIRNIIDTIYCKYLILKAYYSLWRLDRVVQEYRETQLWDANKDY